VGGRNGIQEKGLDLNGFERKLRGGNSYQVTRRNNDVGEGKKGISRAPKRCEAQRGGLSSQRGIIPGGDKKQKKGEKGGRMSSWWLWHRKGWTRKSSSTPWKIVKTSWGEKKKILGLVNEQEKTFLVFMDKETFVREKGSYTVVCRRGRKKKNGYGW